MKNFDFGNLLAVLLLVLFIAFKLAGVISWSWLWVLSPLWIIMIIPIVVFLVGILVYLSSIFLKKNKK